MNKYLVVFIVGSFMFGLSLGVVFDSTTTQFVYPFEGKSEERISPQKWLDSSDLSISSEGVSIHQEGLVLLSFAGTNSMDPLLDENSIGIELQNVDAAEIEVGDIISYEYLDGRVIIHRVVFVGEDEQGRFFRVKGDNAARVDSDIVRENQVKGVLVGVLY